MDAQFISLLFDLEQQGIITRTFRRLDLDRQQAVLQAVLDEAAEKGPVDLSIKCVAERAGVSVGSLYQYFGSRENLMEFAVTLVVQTTVASFNSYRELLAAMPLREALLAYLEGGIEWTQQQLGVARFFARAAYQGDPSLVERVVEPVARGMHAMVSDMLHAAAARGEVRPDADLDALVNVINTILIAAGDAQLIPHLNSYYQAFDDQVTPARFVATLLDLIERGVRPL
jgi:AcrR family transcriptional regulator